MQAVGASVVDGRSAQHRLGQAHRVEELAASALWSIVAGLGGISSAKRPANESPCGPPYSPKPKEPLASVRMIGRKCRVWYANVSPINNTTSRRSSASEGGAAGLGLLVHSAGVASHSNARKVNRR